MFRVQCAAKSMDAVFLPMPLLPELGWRQGGLCYRHGAPNGAVPPGQHAIPPETARDPRNTPNTRKMNGLHEKDCSRARWVPPLCKMSAISGISYCYV
jgi:hypothetical protein